MRWQSSVVALAVALAGAPAGAQGPVGPEFQVNSYTAGDQAYPAACVDPEGQAVVVWESRDQDGDGNGVRAQRYDRAGAPLGTELVVNSYTTDQQQLPAVTCTEGGDFVVVWESRGQDGDDYGVIGRRFDGAGSALSEEFQINGTTADRQRAATTCSDSAGNFVVAWQSYSQDGDGYGIFARRFDAAGVPLGTEFQVNTYTDYSQSNPSVACDAAGEFVVVWDGGEQDGDGYGIFGQRIDSTGAKAGSEFRVNTYTTGTQQLPAVAAAEDGDFVVVWESYDDQDGDGYGVFGQRFSGDGTPSGSEFQVNTYSMFSQQKPAVGAGPNGAFTVAWSSPHGGDGYEVFARHFDAAGVPAGTSEFHVNTNTTGDQGALSAEGRVLSVARGGGNFLIVWQSAGANVTGQDGSGAGVFAQRYGARCAGDCNGDGRVAINELIRGVNMLLESLPVTECFDADGSGSVAVNELILAINSALGGCA